MTKTIKFGKAETSRKVLASLTAAGIQARLAGSHGGDGMGSDGACIIGVIVPAAVHDAFFTTKAAGRPMLEAAIAAGR